MEKQYLLLCGEQAKAALEAVLKGVEFLEVQGMNLNGENKLNILVTPVIPPVNQAYVAPQMPVPPPPADAPVDAPVADEAKPA